MKRLLDWVQGVALALGGPGLFILAFLDSSFLSFPEVVDLLLMWMVTQHEERMLYYAFMATAGSIAGCYALYHVARKGGEAFLRKRLKDRHVDRTMALFQKYGLAAVAIPSILPPPVPFKVFVLAAGVARVRPLEFILAVAIGRGVRYFGEALLAYWYGDRAAQFLAENTVAVSGVIAVTVLAFVAIWMWSRRNRAEAQT
jgi:membrane protein YqaA with SNARE-associated domain